MKLGNREYCRMHTPPIIVQQSYINWLYHEEDNFDWIDAKHSFTNIVERIVNIIDVPLPDDYEDIEVYTCGDLSFLKLEKFKKKFSKKELKFIHSQLLNSESYFMAKGRVAYIANVSINHAAEEASHYLKFLLSGLEKPRSHKDAFYANVLHEAIGFFGSKLINRKRKCVRLQGFKNEIRFLSAAGLETRRHVEYETSDLFIKHVRGVRQSKLLHTNKITRLSQKLFLSLSHAIGYDLGDHLYYGFMDGKITKQHIQKLYTDPFSGEGVPGELFLSFSKMLKGVRRPKRF